MCVRWGNGVALSRHGCRYKGAVRAGSQSVKSVSAKLSLPAVSVRAGITEKGLRIAYRKQRHIPTHTGRTERTPTTTASNQPTSSRRGFSSGSEMLGCTYSTMSIACPVLSQGDTRQSPSTTTAAPRYPLYREFMIKFVTVPKYPFFPLSSRA